MHVSVTAVGVDRPGIVAAVTRVLTDLGANIEDSRMAILGGHFSMMLIVALSSIADVAALESALAEPARALDLIVSVRAVAEVPAEHAEGADYVVSVYGADRTGIVAEMTAVLAEHRVNIRDLATHVVEGKPPVYVMLLEVTVPGGTDPAALETALVRTAGALGVNVSIHPAETETL
jgi:glycine cleavage system transcriptional repressor